MRGITGSDTTKRVERRGKRWTEGWWFLKKFFPGFPWGLRYIVLILWVRIFQDGAAEWNDLQ